MSRNLQEVTRYGSAQWLMLLNLRPHCLGRLSFALAPWIGAISAGMVAFVFAGRTICNRFFPTTGGTVPLDPLTTNMLRGAAPPTNALLTTLGKPQTNKESCARLEWHADDKRKRGWVGANSEYALLIVWAFLAEFSERLVAGPAQPHRQKDGGSCVKSFLILLLFALFLPAGGCAFHYYDNDTGTEHLWGFGHFRMKAPPKTGARPVVTGSHMLGLNLRAGRDDYGVGVGFDSQSRITMPTNGGTLLLQWPTNFPGLPREMRDLFNVRVGTNLPPDMERTSAGNNATNQNTP